MPILYFLHGCPYCDKVIDRARELGVALELRDVEDTGVVDELVAHGGKRQVPYLIDATHGIAMYESGAIIRYIEDTY